MFKVGSRAVTVSKMELFMTIFNAVQPSTIVTKSSISDAVAVSPRSASEILFGGNLSYLLRFFCFVLADLVRKEWEKLRNRYLRVKRVLYEKNVSRTGTISLKNRKRKMEELNCYHGWSLLSNQGSQGEHTPQSKNVKKKSQYLKHFGVRKNRGFRI